MIGEVSTVQGEGIQRNPQREWAGMGRMYHLLREGWVSCKVEHSVLTSRSIFKKHLSAGTHLDVPYQIGYYLLNNCYWYVVT